MVPVFIESFPQMCFAGQWLQNRLRADKNESRSILAVDIPGHQRGGRRVCMNSFLSSYYFLLLALLCHYGHRYSAIIMFLFLLFFLFLISVSYVAERPWWPIQSHNKESKKAKGYERERDQINILLLFLFCYHNY